MLEIKFNIYWDLGNVYFKGHSNLRDLGLKKYFSTQGKCDPNTMVLYSKGLISPDEFWKRKLTTIKEETRTEFTKEFLMKQWLLNYEVNSQMQEIVRNLRKQGYKNYVISNTTIEKDRFLEEKFHYRKEFDGIFVSYEMGDVKPSLYGKIFSLPENSPNKFIVIDDSEKNLEALNLMFPEIKTILCTDVKSVIDGLKKLGVNITDEK